MAYFHLVYFAIPNLHSNWRRTWITTSIRIWFEPNQDWKILQTKCPNIYNTFWGIVNKVYIHSKPRNFKSPAQYLYHQFHKINKCFSFFPINVTFYYSENGRILELSICEIDFSFHLTSFLAVRTFFNFMAYC